MRLRAWRIGVMNTLRTTSVENFAAHAIFQWPSKLSRSKREFTAETRSAPRKEFHEAKLQTLRPLCLCGESFFCSLGCGSAAQALCGVKNPIHHRGAEDAEKTINLWRRYNELL